MYLNEIELWYTIKFTKNKNKIKNDLFLDYIWNW